LNRHGRDCQQTSQLDCYTSLDLPKVLATAPGTLAGVQLVGGTIFDSSTIPKCDAILMKHSLHRCMWKEDESVAILQSCADTGAKVIVIAEAVLPDIGHNNTNNDSQHVSLYMDAPVQYILLGRKSKGTTNPSRVGSIGRASRISNPRRCHEYDSAKLLHPCIGTGGVISTGVHGG
jgi:hypothetical protein